MKAIITQQLSNARNYGNEKETVNKFVVLGKINGELREVVDCRCYMARSASASVVYASVWVHGNNIYTSGKGSAGGYGYHKESAAVGSALSNAGIELWGSPYANEVNTWLYDEQRSMTPKEIAARRRKQNKQRAHIGGCGDESLKAALLATAKAAGARGKLTIVSM